MSEEKPDNQYAERLSCSGATEPETKDIDPVAANKEFQDEGRLSELRESTPLVNPTPDNRGKDKQYTPGKDNPKSG